MSRMALGKGLITHPSCMTWTTFHMQTCMSRLIGQLHQIFRTIIGFIAVDMMNYLSPFYWIIRMCYIPNDMRTEDFANANMPIGSNPSTLVIRVCGARPPNSLPYFQRHATWGFICAGPATVFWWLAVFSPTASKGSPTHSAILRSFHVRHYSMDI